MDSHKYFERAERANRRFRIAIIVIFLGFIVATIALLFALLQLQESYHDTSKASLDIITQNESKLNQNLTNSIHCILLLTPQTYNVAAINGCFATAQQSIINQPVSK
jgi:Na+/H+ antiporter NhaC